MRHAEAAGIPRDTPWYRSRPSSSRVISGTPNWNGNWNQQWYGIRRFFEYLENKAYKMHIRVLLSKYRSYTPCPVLRRRAPQDRACCGASAPPRPMRTPCWPAKRASMPRACVVARAAGGAARPDLHDLMLLPIDACANS